MPASPPWLGRLPLLLLLLLSTPSSCSLQLSVASTWDGTGAVQHPATLALAADPAGLRLTVTAKFYNDPAPSGPAGAFFRLWDYEVVELFLLNDAGLYLEVEVGPWGHHLVLLLDKGKDLRHSLILQYTATRAGDRWTGTAVIPTSYLPPNISKLNAYAIHGRGEERRYEALYPALPGVHKAPGFHRLQYFQPVDFRRISYRPTELSLVWEEAMAGVQSYSIGLTWDGQALDHSPARISFRGVPNPPEADRLEITITAPYFGDPAPEGGKPGEAFFKLWDYEVVEAFFLNDQEQYLELEFGPHGQHLMLILDGNRNAIKHSLPMDYTASIEGDTWTGRATVPAAYFPPNITLFNAYAIHGTGEDRRYEALYESSGPQPDFHRLEKFQALDFQYLLPANKEAQLSAVWTTAMEEAKVGKKDTSEKKNEFLIQGTWDGKPIDHDPVKLALVGAGEDLIIRISAPYFGDPAPEGGKPGEAFFKLWDYEVVEAFFLNDQEQYLELEFGPHGQHLMLILNGNRNAIKHSLPMDYSATIDPSGVRWSGEARVPAAYFPPDVTRWNAYAIHGVGEDRVYEALFESSGPQPDFHRLEKFQPLDLGESLLEGNKGQGGSQLSGVWQTALEEDRATKEQ